MAEVTFYFPRQIEYAVRVEVNDPADITDEDIDAAYEGLPSGICAQCSGWGKNWSLDLDTMEGEFQRAEDTDGNVIWGELPK